MSFISVKRTLIKATPAESLGAASRWVRQRPSDESLLSAAIYGAVWFMVIRPIFFSMDSEDAHHIVIGALSLMDG